MDRERRRREHRAEGRQHRQRRHHAEDAPSAGRGGTRPASLRQGARPRAAPKPPARNAMPNPAVTACHSDGAASAVLLATATAPVNSA